MHAKNPFVFVVVSCLALYVCGKGEEMLLFRVDKKPQCVSTKKTGTNIHKHQMRIDLPPNFLKLPMSICVYRA